MGVVIEMCIKYPGGRTRIRVTAMSLPQFRLLFVAAPAFTVKPLFFSSQPLPRL